jgi:hypothetical protein
MAHEKMTIKAYHWNKAGKKIEDTPVDTRYDMPHTHENTTGDAPSYGMPTTLEAYLEMVEQFRLEAVKNPAIFSNLRCVTFSKASIFRLLSQEGCEAIRIWQALPYGDGKVSFVLEGLNENHRPIKEATVLQAATEKDNYVHNDGDPFYEERGNGKDGGFASLKSLSQEQLTTQSLPAFMEAMFTALAKK